MCHRARTRLHPAGAGDGRRSACGGDRRLVCRATVAAGALPGYTYVESDAERAFVLPTAMGLRKAVSLAPASVAGGDLAGGQALVIVGSDGLRDFHAGLCAANLSAR